MNETKKELNQNELNQNELNQNELNQNELNQNELNQINEIKNGLNQVDEPRLTLTTKCLHCGYLIKYNWNDIQTEELSVMRVDADKEDYYRMRYNLNKIMCPFCKEEIGISWNKERIEWDYEKVLIDLRNRERQFKQDV